MPKKTALVPTEVELDDAPVDGIGALVAHNRQLADMVLQKDRAMFELVALMVGNYTDMREQQTASSNMLLSYQRQIVENTKLEQQMLNEQADRDAKRERERVQSELLREGFDQLKPLAQLAINKAVKRPILSIPEKSVLKPLVESLTERQTEQLLSILEAPQRAALLKILDALEPEKPVEAPEKTEGVDDAAH